MSSESTGHIPPSKIGALAMDFTPRHTLKMIIWVYENLGLIFVVLTIILISYDKIVPKVFAEILKQGDITTTIWGKKL